MNFKLLLLMIMASLSLNGQVFINAGATGANNGSSWANAYTDLSVAITNAPANSQLWIATGTYKPGATRNDFFDIQNGLELYGGFAGNETTLSQRDFTSNLTILSGDIAGNDVPDNFTTNRTDNSRHIVWVPNILSDAVTFDGLVFEGGQTDDGSGSGNDRRGAAILSYSKIVVKNCVFRQNYGYFGSVYPRQAGANNSEFSNCAFSNSDGGFGAGIFLASTIGFIDNCTFTNLTSTDNGSAITATNTTYTITNSTFTNNTSAESGAIMTNSSQGGTHLCKISNTDFINNSARFGGAVQTFNLGIEVDFENCTFTDNSAITRGGAVSADAKSIVRFNGCTFQNNEAPQGGAIGVYDVTSTSVEDCTFLGNTAIASGISYGGAILFADSPLLQVVGSTFDGNTSYNGGAIQSENTTPGANVFINKSTFKNNTATNLGGGVGSVNSDIEIGDCLIVDNSAALTGGGVFLATTNLGGTASILNTTIANNQAPGAGGISQNISGTGALDLVLQNTILENPTANYQNNSASAIPTLSSSGGNLSSDASLVSFLNGTNDVNNTSAAFVNASTGDYHLSAGSPAINQAVGTVSPTDLDGLPRVGAPDMGAFEYQGASSNADIQYNSNAITVFPNPVHETLNFTLENKWRGNLEIEVVDSKGAVVYHVNLEKTQDNIAYSLDLSSLASGTYHLAVNGNNSLAVKTFVIYNQ